MTTPANSSAEYKAEISAIAMQKFFSDAKIYTVGPNSEYATVRAALDARILDTDADLGSITMTSDGLLGAIAADAGSPFAGLHGRFVYYNDTNFDTYIGCIVLDNQTILPLPIGDLVGTLSSAGRNVFVPTPSIIQIEAGVYVETGAVMVLPALTWIRGAGKDSTFINGLSAGGDALFTVFTDSTVAVSGNGWRFSDFSVSGTPVIDDGNANDKKNGIYMLENIRAGIDQLIWYQLSLQGSAFLSMRGCEEYVHGVSEPKVPASMRCIVDNHKWYFRHLGSVLSTGEVAILTELKSRHPTGVRAVTRITNSSVQREILGQFVGPAAVGQFFEVLGNAAGGTDIFIKDNDLLMYAEVANDDYTAHIIGTTGSSGANVRAYLESNFVQALTNGTGTVTKEFLNDNNSNVKVYSARNVDLEQGAWDMSGVLPFQAMETVTQAYGGITSAGAGAQTLVSGTPEKLEGFDANMPSSNMTPAFGSNQVTCLIAGDYEVSAQFSFQGANGSINEFEVRVDGAVVSPALRTIRTLGTAGTQVGSASITGILTLAVNEVVSVYIEVDDTTITIDEAQLMLKSL